MPASQETLKRWLLTLGLFSLLLFFFSPAWSALRRYEHMAVIGHMIELRRANVVLAQMIQPGAPIEDQLHQVIQWRLFFPVMGNLLSLSPAAFFSLAPAGAFLTLRYIVSLLRRHSLGWLDTFFAGFALGASAWFFTTTGWLGYFDAWVILCLLIAAFHPSIIALAVTCLVAPWIDERFVMAAPVALFCRYLYATSIDRRPAEALPFARRWRAELLVSAVLLILFIVIRLGILGGESSVGGATVKGYLAKQKILSGGVLIAGGVWEGLRSGWFFVGAGFALIWRRSNKQGIVFVASVIGFSALSLASAQDYGRSMATFAPAAVLGAILLAELDAARLRPTLAVLAGLTALVPAYHVMNDQAKPIFYLPYEAMALKQLPQYDRPEGYQLYALSLKEQGEFAQAFRYLDKAIILANNPAAAAHQRGEFFLELNRWNEAIVDFSIVLQIEKGNPEAWLARAKAYQAIGNEDAARSDFENARRVAPATWLSRTDVMRLQAELRTGFN